MSLILCANPCPLASGGTIPLGVPFGLPFTLLTRPPDHPLSCTCCPNWDGTPAHLSWIQSRRQGWGGVW